METITEELTVKQLEDLCALCFAKREEIEKIEDNLSGVKAELEALSQRVLTYLEDLGKSNYECAVGKISTRDTFSISNPKTPEAKKEFFDYLKARGIFEDLISVHSNT